MNTDEIYVWIGGEVSFKALRDNTGSRGSYEGMGFYRIRNRTMSKVEKASL